MSLLIPYSSRGASELAVIKTRKARCLLRKAARAGFRKTWDALESLSQYANTGSF